jgi:tetratricopeptide (TPR) repeat protein
MAADIYNQGRTEPALRLFDSILKKNPGNLRSLEMRINCLLLLQRNAEAIEPLQEYLRRTPGSAIDHFNLAVCLHGEGRAEDAIESYRRALQRESNRPAWLPDFLGLLRSQGLGEEARRWNRRFSAPSGSPPGN